MAIDPSILLRGIVADPVASAAQGFQLGQSIRNAPILRQMQEQRVVQGERQAQSEELGLGQKEALAVNSIVGDSTADQITPEIFESSARALQQLGVQLTPEELVFSPANVTDLINISQAGKRLSAQARGQGQKRVQSVQQLGGDTARIFFNDGTTNLVSGTEAEAALVQKAQEDQLDFERRKSGARSGGTVEGRVGAESETLDVAADTEAELARVKTQAQEQAKVDVEAGSAEKVGNARNKLNFLATSGTLDARDQNLLKKTSGARKRNISKAESFRDALQQGLRTSGVGRQVALFSPIGVWTDQGSFDEIFNSFAEIAARETLKASGETRPTDADVQGMKNAMFGVGRSEEANIQLLNEFIEEQNALEGQLVGGRQGGSGALLPSELQELEALRREFGQ